MPNFEPLEEPEKKTVRQLTELAMQGDLGIPDFQREFVWDRQDVSELVESILRGYYVGSLLFWGTSGEGELESYPVRGVIITKEKFAPRYLVLDGQQRVSSLFYVAVAPNMTLWSTRHPYLFFINLKKLVQYLDEAPEFSGGEDKLVFSEQRDRAIKNHYDDRKVQYKNWFFPLSMLGKYNDWLFDFRDYLTDTEGKTKDQAKLIVEKLREHLAFAWERFEIPVIKLQEGMDLENVAKVFEKLNTMGVELTIFDLLNARMLKHGIRLRTDLWKIARESYGNLKVFSDKSEKFPVYILQTVALLRRKIDAEGIHVSTKAKDLLKLDHNGFQADWERASKWIDIALTRLKQLHGDGFGVIGPKFVPYVTMLPVMAALLAEAETKANKPAGIAKISKWYWSSIITKAYSGSTESTVAADFREVMEWFDDDAKVPRSVTAARTEINTVDLGDVTQTFDALYKGVLSIIALHGGRDFRNNDTLDLSSLDDHHIFPESRAADFKVDKDDLQTVLNKTLIEKDTNRNYIRNKKPSEYLGRIATEQHLSGPDLAKRLGTHLIPTAGVSAMQQDNFEEFVKARSAAIKSALKTKIE